MNKTSDTFFQPAIIFAGFVSISTIAFSGIDSREYYKHSTWQPRVTLPAAEALKGDFAPPSPQVPVDYAGPGFAEERLSAVPPPGVHPRVFFSPHDIDLIRNKVALGEKAPLAFRKLWTIESKAKTPFYALVTQDEALGKELAAKLVEKAGEIEPKVANIQRRKGLEKDNLWALRGTLDGEKSPDGDAVSINQFFAYDYLYQWLTPEQRSQIRRIIAQMTAKKSTNFMEVPDHFMINNHLSFGMGELVPPMLLIEGEEGYDPQTFALVARKVRALLTYYFSPSGMCYETIKGWLNTPVYLAVVRRERDLLKHSHLRAKMQYQLQAARWQDGGWRIREEMRNSAFHVNFLMHYFYPADPMIDFLYKASLATHHLDDDTPATTINTVGCTSDVLLFLADDGMVDAEGKPYSCEDQARLNALNAPLTWSCPQRGYMEAHNTWRKDDLHVSVFGKQDFIYNGHEGPEQGRFLIWKDGVNWAADLSMLFNKVSANQNMVSIDGKGSLWPPVSSTWLGVVDAPLSATAVVDYRDAYSFVKSAQVHPFLAPEVATARFKGWDEGNFRTARDLQLPFHDVVVKFHDGYAHTDYGTWNGETRVTENYRNWNPMQNAFRTLHLARGKFPYILFFDDLLKDGQKHLYEWNMTLPGNIELFSSRIIGAGDGVSAPVMCEMLFGKIDTPRKAGVVYSGVPELSYQPKKGDPLLLVRVLQRQSEYGMPMPRFERYLAFNKISVPSISVSPEFRILVYPHKQGDPLPTTLWNRLNTELVVDFPGQKDLYRLSKTDGDRTVFAQERDGKIITSSQARPTRPLLQVRGRTFDTYADRYTRYAKRIPELLVDQPVTVSFPQPQLGTEIRYTRDGSEPSRESACYLAPITIASSAQVRARTFVRDWPFGPESSETVAANFRCVTREPGETIKTTTPTNGLVLKVYEVATVPYNDKGFFDAGKSMLPKLSDGKAVSIHRVDTFQFPHLNASAPQREQRKAFFAFTGFFKAPTDGIYEFAIDSCGPVTLDIGKQTAIEEIGQYHQNQKVRRGEVALAAGWHTIALTVCDPIFWKINMDDPMPLKVTFKVNGGKEQEIDTDQLLCDAGREACSSPIMIAQHDPVSLLVEPGLELVCYDRKEKERDDDYLDIDGLTPFATENRSDIAPNANGNVVNVYNGYFFAPTDGLYTFDAPARTFDSYDRNQIRIGSEVVVQRGVPGRNPLRKVFLKTGYHPISLRLGSSRSDFTVYYPNSTNEVRLTASGLYRPVRVAIIPEDRQEAQRLYEIFKPTRFTMSVPPAAGKLEIHYTLDGKLPTVRSPTFEKSVDMDHSVTLKALAFKEGKPVTAITSVRCERVSLPQAALLGYWDFKTIGKETAPPVCGKVVARIAGASSVTDASGPSLQLSGAKMGLQLVNLGMVDNALSVSLWLKMEAPGVTLLTDGKYHQILGASYFGRGYSIRGGGRAGICKSNEWQHLVFTWNGDDTAIHVDGVEVNRQKYTAKLHSDSLDMLMGYKGLLRSLRIYNKALSSAEVSQIYTIEGIPKP
jgi:hypothetical protein